MRASLPAFLPILLLGCPSPPAAVAQQASGSPAPAPGFVNLEVELEPVEGTESFDAFAAEVEFEGGGGARVLAGSWYELRGSRDAPNGLSEKASPVTYAGNLHRPWDYDQAEESRLGTRREPVPLESGRVLHDRPGGVELRAGRELARRFVAHAPKGAFDRVELEAYAWAWDPGAPILLCWRTDEERLTGFVEPWVHTGGLEAVRALEVDADGAQRAVELCRAAQKGASRELEPLSPTRHAELVIRYRPELLRARAEAAPSR